MNYFVLLSFTFPWSYAYSSCKTPLQQRSQCIPLVDCPPLLAAFQQKPIEKEVADFLNKSRCGFIDKMPEVCCGPLPKNLNSPISAQPVIRPKISGPVDPVNPDDSYPTPRDKCGIDTNGDRIYGGESTSLDEYPWMALLGYEPPGSRALTYQCGGMLINHRYVVSAAHCVVGEIVITNGNLKTARLGEYDLRTEVDCLNSVCADPVQEIGVLSAYPHPGYSVNNKNKTDDISVLRLAQRVHYNYYVQPICLSSSDLRLEGGNDVFVAGWGRTLKGKSSPVKLKLNLPIYNKNECVKKYQDLNVTLTDKQLCAGGVLSQDTCRGDSGGPLMRTIAGTWEAVGVVSFGYDCGKAGWPGVYTSIASYRGWIEDIMSSSNV